MILSAKVLSRSTPVSFMPSLNSVFQCVVVLIALQTCINANPVQRNCDTPSTDVLTEQLEQHRKNSDFGTDDAFLAVNSGRSSSVSDIYPPTGRKTCPSADQVRNSGEEFIGSRSTCPWDYKTNHDPTRHPADLVEVYCLCKDCIENNVNYCETVTYNVPVLRQSDRCSNGVWEFNPTWESIAVACTCAKHKTSVASSISEIEPVIL